jgi:hypothetical protein
LITVNASVAKGKKANTVEVSKFINLSFFISNP